MDRNLIKYFWDCGDSQIIEFAILRARLNRHEQDVIHLLLDECMTQETASEKLNISPRNLQNHWYKATDKLLSIPWVYAYAEKLRLK